MLLLFLGGSLQTPPAGQSPKLKPGRQESGREGRRERENREGGAGGRTLPSPLSAQRVFSPASVL